MTKTQIALNAIKGTDLSNRTHIDIMETMRTLKLGTDEAVELRQMVGGAWTTEINANGYDTDLAEVLSLAKTVTNQYARDVRFR